MQIFELIDVMRPETEIEIKSWNVDRNTKAVEKVALYRGSIAKFKEIQFTEVKVTREVISVSLAENRIEIVILSI